MKTSKDRHDLVDWIRLVPARAENIDDFEMTMMMVTMMMIPMTMIPMLMVTMTMVILAMVTLAL